MEQTLVHGKGHIKQRSKTICIHELHNCNEPYHNSEQYCSKHITYNPQFYDQDVTKSNYTPSYPHSYIENSQYPMRSSKSFTNFINYDNNNITFKDDIDDKSVLTSTFIKQKSHNNFIESINISLLDDDNFYSFDDYIHIYQSLHTNGDELYRMYLFTHRYTGDDFCIPEVELPGIIKVNDIIKRFNLILGKDFIESNEFYKRKWGINMYKKNRLFTPMAFKKLMMYSGDKRLVDYYVFLDEVIVSYESYEKDYLIYHKDKNKLSNREENI